jgi:hypothetical protein
MALVDFNGYIAFGNYPLPYAAAQYSAYMTPPWVWTPYQYYGIPDANPWGSLMGYITSAGPRGLLAAAFGPLGAAKLYMVGSTFLLGVSFLLFSRSMIRRPVGQFLAAAFVLAGPFQVALYAQGDFQQFVSEAMVLLGLFVLWQAIQRPDRRWLLFPLSLWLLVLSISTIQIFVLGSALYVVFALVFVYRSRPRPRFVAAAVPVLLRFAMLPVLLAPLVVTVLYGSFNVGPSSPLALPLTTFVTYGSEPYRLFFLQGYFTLEYNLVALLGTGIALAWIGLVIAFLAAVWVGGLVVRDARILLCFLIALAASLFGSGGVGPLAPFNDYLYLHVTGFQVLNASYYWDWMLVVPAYAIAFGALYDDLREHSRVTAVPAPPNLPGRLVERVRRRYRRSTLRALYGGFATGLVLLFLMVAGIPYGLQAPYHGPSGMRDIDYPSDFAQVSTVLGRLIGDQYAGVALFNPDLNWFLNNSSLTVPNAYFLFPTVRTVGITVYGAYPTTENTFAYWVYQQFYENTTRYVGALFATVGVEYFLVFNRTQSGSGYHGTFLNFSENRSADGLMRYQVGVVPAYVSGDFTVYRNLFYGGVANAATNLSIVAGGYEELNALAYAGVNLTDQAFLFTTDLTPGSCAKELALVARVYTEDLNALLSLALDCAYTSSANPLDFVSSDLGPGQGWTDSTRVLGGPTAVDSWPQTLAISLGGRHVLTIPVTARGCDPNCSLWLPVRFSGDGGILNFSWGGRSVGYNTSRGYDGVNNSMAWVQLPFSIPDGTGALTVTAHSGWNAIGSVLTEGTAETGEANVLATLARELGSATVVQATPGAAINLVRPGAPPASGGRGAYYASCANGSDPGGSALLLEEPYGGSFDVPVPTAALPGGGWVSLLIRANASATVEVGLGAGSQTVVVVAAPTTGSGGNWSWIRLYLNGSGAVLGTPIGLTIENGSIRIGQVDFVPGALEGSPPPVVPGPVLALAGSTTGNGSWGLHVAVAGGPAGVTEVTGSATAVPAPFETRYATIELAGTLPAGRALALSLNATPGIVVGVGGVYLGGSTGGRFDSFDAPLGPGPTDATMGGLAVVLLSYGDLPSAGAIGFSLSIAVTDAVNRLNVSDLDDRISTSVTADGSGYVVTTSAPAPLLLVRVALYPGMTTTASGVSLSPALGSLATLLWNPDGVRQAAVTLSDTALLELAIEGAMLATVAWVVVEWVARRYQRSRRHPPGTDRAADAGAA